MKRSKPTVLYISFFSLIIFLGCWRIHVHCISYNVRSLTIYSITLLIGLRGLMLAALLAALMSSLTSILNSASAIATMDIWKQFRKKATQAELMVVGRVTVMILVVISIVWLPIMDAAQGGMFWFYFIGIRSYFLPQMCILFVLGLFWKRLTEQVKCRWIVSKLKRNNRIKIIQAMMKVTFYKLCAFGAI